MINSEIWKDSAEIDGIIGRMTDELRSLIAERAIETPLMIGIHTGGVWVADRLHEALELTEPLGHLDISFYRDDFTRIGMHPQVRPSYLPVGIDDRHLILVDDVLQSGRTIRAALNVLFDYGRPAVVEQDIQGRANGTTALQDIIDQDQMTVVDPDRQIGGAHLRMHPDACEVVAIEGDIQMAERLGQLQCLVQPIRNPDPAGMDADHQRGFDGALGDERAQLVGHPTDDAVDLGAVLPDLGIDH